MGYREGDPYPCDGTEPADAVYPLDENDTPQPMRAIWCSACFADWYLGGGRWVWRDAPTPPAELPPMDEESPPVEVDEPETPPA